MTFHQSNCGSFFGSVYNFELVSGFRFRVFGFSGFGFFGARKSCIFRFWSGIIAPCTTLNSSLLQMLMNACLKVALKQILNFVSLIRTKALKSILKNKPI